jgi:hypothetical protein
MQNNSLLTYRTTYGTVSRLSTFRGQPMTVRARNLSLQEVEAFKTMMDCLILPVLSGDGLSSLIAMP